jgi:hypothetical protein
MILIRWIKFANQSLCESFPEVPQRPKYFWKRLRNSRKDQDVFGNTCGNPAKTKMLLEVKIGDIWAANFLLSKSIHSNLN